MNVVQHIQTKFLQAFNQPEPQTVDRRAVERAFVAFSQKHPDWAASFFDMHFLTHAGAPVLPYVGQGNSKNTAHALAIAWTRQFAWNNEQKRQTFVDELTPVAGTFLRLLEIELGLRTTAHRLAIQTV
ncbi:MAG: hypothetical protein KDJ52_20670 [Anaerolineae bacterium]|nr:hypothetical protein [Anaerolineae bacterium]